MRFLCHVQSVCISLLVASAGFASATALPPALTRTLHDAGIPLDAVAVFIQPIDASRPILSYRSASPMNPASVMKLVTSLAALDKLGPAYRWKTEIWTQGNIQNRTLHGDLLIKGYGDPTLTLERIWLLQRELRARGIEAIRGNLILDSSYFVLPALDAGTLDGEPLAIYNALPAALLANYNATAFRFNVTGDTLTITPELPLSALIVTSHLVLDNATCDEWKNRLKPVFSDPTRRELVFEGSYAHDCGEKHLSLNAYEATQNFDITFRALWKESGGELSGNTRLGTAPADTPPLLSFSSITLTEALRDLNKYSNNLMTRNLFLTLGAEINGAPATLEKSSQVIHAWLADKHIAAPELILENGAGLSRNERISAQTLGRLLLTAYQSPYFSEYESALPILAVDGTLKRRFTDSALVGRAHLKSGTLKDVRALAGYVLSRAGKRIVFVMLINGPHAENAEAAQRALLDWTYTYPSMPSRRLRDKK